MVDRVKASVAPIGKSGMIFFHAGRGERRGVDGPDPGGR